MTIDFLNTPLVELYLEDGILYEVYVGGFELDLEKAGHIAAERKKFCAGNSYPFLADLRRLKGGTLEAGKFYSSPEVVKNFQCAAFVVESFVSKLLISFYLNIFPAGIPAKIFHNSEEAVRWLKETSEAGV